MQRYFAGELRPDQEESWKADDGIFVLYTDHLVALAEKEAKLTALVEEIDIQDQMLNPGEHICEREINGVTICVLRKDLWDIRSIGETKKAEEQNTSLLKKLERSNNAWISGQEQIATLKEEKERLQRARIADAEIIGRWQCESERLTAENADLRKCIEDEAVKIFRNENTALTTENKRLRQIVVDCYAGWSDEVLQKTLQGKEAKDES